ncbi:hypothetical protein [Candidatus Solirubrobacter pratensis]|nr:hypothetical protein [Candidatus Solirubrobacter pratensis]
MLARDGRATGLHDVFADGRYTFAHPQLNGALRPLRDPHATDDEADLAA